MRAKWSMLFGPEGSIILWPKGSILFGQRGQICLAFPYTIEYAVWDSGKQEYADVVAKQTYHESIDGALYIALYRWDDSGNDWVKQNDMVAMNLSGELLTSFEFEL